MKILLYIGIIVAVIFIIKALGFEIPFVSW